MRTNVITGVALSNKAAEILRTQIEGAYLAKISVKDNVDVVVGASKKHEGVEVPIASYYDAIVPADDLGYVRNGATVSFSGSSLQSPVIAGTISVEATATSPAVIDTNRDGIMYLDGAARKRAGSGTFAAMASEVMTLKIDGDNEQTITFGTEATIGAAVLKINSQLVGGYALAQGAQNVDIYSNTTGPLSSVEVLSVATGITTKLGISRGSSGTAAGTVTYHSGALTLSYPGGYAPARNEGSGAELIGSVAGPWAIPAAATLVINTNAGGNETVTFDAVAATVTGAAGAFSALAGETFKVQFESGAVQTITMGTEATIALAISTINAQLIGGYCAAVDANNVKILSDKKGTGSRVRTSTVAAGITTKLGIANNADQAGTGDCADNSVVTAAEAKTVIEADTTGLTVTIEENKLVLTATTSIAVTAGVVQILMNLSTTTATATSGGSGPLLVDYIRGGRISGRTTGLLMLSGFTQGDELVLRASGKDAPCSISVELTPM